MGDTDRGEVPPSGKGRRNRTEVARPPLGTTPVPGQIPSQIMKIIEAAGNIDLSRLPPTWKAEHPETPLAYRDWGFERLRDYIATLHASIVMTPTASGRDFILTMPGTPIPEKALALPKEKKGGNVPGGANAVIPSLAEILAANGGDVAGVTRVLKQGKYKFTIEALAREVALDLAKPAGAGRRPPRGKKADGEAEAE